MKSLFAFLLLSLLAAPLSAAEREVRLERDFGTLFGTLRTPEGGNRTAALLIAGSGPTDRNSNSVMGLYTDSFVYLARALEKAGIASLRYDKRGIGASRYDDPEKIQEISFDDYIGDAAAWVAWLHEEGFDKVVLIGHSEGALIAFCAAAGSVPMCAAGKPTNKAGDAAACAVDNESTGTAGSLRACATDNEPTKTAGIPMGEAHNAPADATDNALAGAADRETTDASDRETTPDYRIDGVVSLAGPGFPLDRVVLTQLSAQYDIGTILRAAEVFNSLRQGKTVEDYPRELSMLFLPYLQRYWISQLRYDPQEVIRRIPVPVLIVGGTNDIQISADNAEALRKARPDAEVLLIEGMTHPLKQSEGHDAEGQMAVYMDASLPLDPTLAEAVPRFILGL